MVACRGKTALVTNASRREGRVAAMALASAGAQVLVHDDRATHRIEGIVKRIHAAGGVAKAITTDTRAPDGPGHLAQQTRAIVGDRLDILVFTAPSPTTPVGKKLSVAAAFDAQLAVRARAPFVLVQQLLPILSRGSSVIFTSPRTKETALDSIPAYLSAANTIFGLTRHFSALLKAKGVRVNAIDLASQLSDSPGPSEGQKTFRYASNDESSISRADLQVGEAVTFLASNDAHQITGETIKVAFS